MTTSTGLPKKKPKSGGKRPVEDRRPPRSPDISPFQTIEQREVRRRYPFPFGRTGKNAVPKPRPADQPNRRYGFRVRIPFGRSFFRRIYARMQRVSVDILLINF